MSLGFLLMFCLYSSRGTLPSIAVHPLIMVVGRSWGYRELGVELAESWNKNCQFSDDFPVLCIWTESICTWTQIPCFSHLTPHFAFNRTHVWYWRYRQSVVLCFSILVNWGRLFFCSLEIFTPPGTPGTIYFR